MFKLNASDANALLTVATYPDMPERLLRQIIGRIKNPRVRPAAYAIRDLATRLSYSREYSPNQRAIAQHMLQVVEQNRRLVRLIPLIKIEFPED